MEGTSDMSDGSGADSEPRPEPFPMGRTVEPAVSAVTSGRLRPGFGLPAQAAGCWGLTASAPNHFNTTARAAWGVRVTLVQSRRIKIEDVRFSRRGKK